MISPHLKHREVHTDKLLKDSFKTKKKERLLRQCRNRKCFCRVDNEGKHINRIKCHGGLWLKSAVVWI